MVSLPAGKSFDACHTLLSLTFPVALCSDCSNKGIIFFLKILNVYFTRARVKMLKSALASHYVH